MCKFCCYSVAIFVTLWTEVRQIPLSSTVSQGLFKLMSIESVMPSNRLILCHPFSSCLQSLPASGPFPMSRLLASGGQSFGASASVLSMNIHGWFPLGLTALISLQSKGLSWLFSNTTVWKRQFFSTEPYSESTKAYGKKVSILPLWTWSLCPEPTVASCPSETVYALLSCVFVSFPPLDFNPSAVHTGSPWWHIRRCPVRFCGCGMLCYALNRSSINGTVLNPLW